VNNKMNESSNLLATVNAGMWKCQFFRIFVFAGILVLGTRGVRLSHKMLSQSPLDYSGSRGRSVDYD
jgi:hypothetical protein